MKLKVWKQKSTFNELCGHGNVWKVFGRSHCTPATAGALVHLSFIFLVVPALWFVLTTANKTHRGNGVSALGGRSRFFFFIALSLSLKEGNVGIRCRTLQTPTCASLFQSVVSPEDWWDIFAGRCRLFSLFNFYGNFLCQSKVGMGVGMSNAHHFVILDITGTQEAIRHVRKLFSCFVVRVRSWTDGRAGLWRREEVNKSDGTYTTTCNGSQGLIALDVWLLIMIVTDSDRTWCMIVTAVIYPPSWWRFTLYFSRTPEIYQLTPLLVPLHLISGMYDHWKYVEWRVATPKDWGEERPIKK